MLAIYDDVVVVLVVAGATVLSVVNHRFYMIFFCLRFFVVVDTKVINFQNMYVVEDFFVPRIFCAEKFSNYYYWFFCCSDYFSIFFAAVAAFFLCIHSK